MRQVFDYSVLLETTHSPLKLALQDPAKTFLDVMSITPKEKLDYHTLSVLENEGVLTAKVNFGLNLGVEESALEAFYNTYSELDYNLRLEVFIHDEAQLGSVRIFANGSWITVNTREE